RTRAGTAGAGRARTTRQDHRRAPRLRHLRTRTRRGVSRRLASHLAHWAWAGATPAARTVRASLGAPAAVYGMAIAARNQADDRGGSRVERVGARVLSVGIVTAGGTGKTPTSLWLAQALQARGRHVALVARGYRKTRPGVVFVGRAGVPLVSPAEGGDEAVML